jgi:hypothetical protein
VDSGKIMSKLGVSATPTPQAPDGTLTTYRAAARRRS